MPVVRRFGPRKFAYAPASAQVVDELGNPAVLYDETGTAVVAGPTIAADGAVTFWAVPGRYRLKLNRPDAGQPTTVSTVLDAPTNADGEGLPVSGSPQARATARLTTPSLSALGRAKGLISMSSGYRVLRVQTNRPARVRLYVNAIKRDADENRPAGTDPTGDHGLFLDVVTTPDLLTITLAPLAYGFVETGSAVPITITNMDSGAGEVVVTLTYVRTE